jgi:lysozyme family protein
MADAKTAILLTLQHEGGFQKDPSDRANWSSGIVGVGKLIGTKYGITALDLPGADIENLTPDAAVAYYSTHYWSPAYTQIDSQALADKLFDMGVLFGTGLAVKVLQFVLGITVDGHFGPQSLAAANAAHPSFVVQDYKTRFRAEAERIAIENPNEAKFKDGWENRINS